MKIKTTALREPTDFGVWQQIRASDKPVSQESPVGPEMVEVAESVPEEKAKYRGTWQQVRETDTTESSTS